VAKAYLAASRKNAYKISQSHDDAIQAMMLFQNKEKNLSANVVELTVKIAALEQQAVRPCQALESMSVISRIANLEKQLAEIGPNSQELVQNHLLHYRTEAESLRTENLKLMDRVALLEKQRSISGTPPDDSVSNIEDLPMLNDSQIQEIDHLRRQSQCIQQADLKMTQIVLENEELKNQISKLVGQVSSPGMFLFDLKKDSAELQYLRERLNGISEDHSKEVASLKDELDSLQVRINSSNVILIEELQAINEAQSQEIKGAQAENELLRKTLENRNSEQQNSIDTFSENMVEKLQLMNEDQMFELETLRLDLDEEKIAHQNDVKRLELDVKNTEQFFETEILNLKGQQIENSVSSDVLDRLKRENDSYHIKLESLEVEMATLRSSYAKFLENNPNSENQVWLASEQKESQDVLKERDLANNRTRELEVQTVGKKHQQRGESVNCAEMSDRAVAAAAEISSRDMDNRPDWAAHSQAAISSITNDGDRDRVMAVAPKRNKHRRG
jgi:hypothetical protein